MEKLESVYRIIGSLSILGYKIKIKKIPIAKVTNRYITFFGVSGRKYLVLLSDLNIVELSDKVINKMDFVLTKCTCISEENVTKCIELTQDLCRTTFDNNMATMSTLKEIKVRGADITWS